IAWPTQAPVRGSWNVPVAEGSRNSIFEEIARTNDAPAPRLEPQSMKAGRRQDGRNQEPRGPKRPMQMARPKGPPTAESSGRANARGLRRRRTSDLLIPGGVDLIKRPPRVSTENAGFCGCDGLRGGIGEASGAVSAGEWGALGPGSHRCLTT